MNINFEAKKNNVEFMIWFPNKLFMFDAIFVCLVELFMVEHAEILQRFSRAQLKPSMAMFPFSVRVPGVLRVPPSDFLIDLT